MDETNSALLVPAPRADALCGALRERLDPAAKAGVPAHVTILHPFALPDAVDASFLDDLRLLFAGFLAFDFALTRTAWFGDSVLWLAPAPDDAFRALTAAVFARWPRYPPYGGRFADVTPHLTIGDGAPHAELRAAEVQVAPMLPVFARASEVLFMCGSSEPRSWKTRASFPLRA